ncbi:MAG TPA: hypothetical protein VEL69_06990, partial [Ktedonobacteraceae bacterium]|nr:hypothetical protein [Ktedonobacteraceae bacterium]
QLLFVLLSTLQLFRCGSGERTPLGASLTAGNRESVASRSLVFFVLPRHRTPSAVVQVRQLR